MREERCELCRFWKQVSATDLKLGGQCRINPPKVGKYILFDGKLIRNDIWSRTIWNEWCGAFEMKGKVVKYVEPGECKECACLKRCQEHSDWSSEWSKECDSFGKKKE